MPVVGVGRGCRQANMTQITGRLEVEHLHSIGPPATGAETMELC